ncbi:MAG: phosphoglycerate kinase, partial [Chloroflexi bacterium]|nr:phosphoglycerate kinase [Chloroflexota bacterium]
RPLVAVMGGAKISDKIAVLENLVGRVDSLLIGGGMAATFLKALGYEIGKSLIEPDCGPLVAKVLEQAKRRGVRVLLPVDLVVASEFKMDAPSHVVPADGVPRGSCIMDIGPQTREGFRQKLRRCRTVFWNGPMGVFEYPAFAKGTVALAEEMASLTSATTIVGGGSSAEAVEELGLADRMTHVSTGGGAALEYLEGKVLPGVAVLPDKHG